MRALARVIGVILTVGSGLSCGSASQTVTAPSTTKCQVTAVAEPATFPATGGAGTLTINTNRECPWNAASSGNWIQLGAQPSGQGNATVAFNVTSNPDPAQRRGMITIGDHQVAITQDAAACTFTVFPLNESVSPDGERRTITVTASNAQCSWSARTETEWLTIVQGSQGSGSGEVVYEARRTTGPSRSGELTVAGQRVIVIQAVGCSVAIAPTTQTVSADGGSGAISVTTAAGCPWSAQSETAWISITSATSGTGPATVTFSVGAWDGPSRTGTLRVGPHVFTVTQGVGCSVAIAPTTQTVSADGGSGAIRVTTAAGCPWSAQSETAWISITSATSGTGPATVTFSVGAWDGPRRTGTVRVGPHVFTVTQNSGCRFSISPESFSVASAGGSGGVAVTTTVAACEWTSTSNAPWITITTGGTGSGNGAVQFTVAPTTGPERSGTLTIAGRTFVVGQSSGCTFSISPTAQTVPSHGGPGSVAVSTSPGCTWTAAAASVPWVRITAGQAGTGPGTVSFTVDGTPSSQPRSTTLSIAGQVFAITQDGAPCLYVLSPSAVGLEAVGGSGAFEVNTPEGCTWTAGSNDAWLRVTAGSSGSGDGTVSFSVDANPGPPRTGTIVAGGRLFTVSQAGAGALALAPHR
jgi:hypothetical protein